MERHQLLGLASVRSVIGATLAQTVHRSAANSVYHAVVAIDEAEGWTAAELRWMGAIQNELIELLVSPGGSD